MFIVILLGVMIGVVLVGLVYTILDSYEAYRKKTYMLIINSQVLYFKSYRDVTDYLGVSDFGYQLFVRDKGEYVFLMSYSAEE